MPLKRTQGHPRLLADPMTMWYTGNIRGLVKSKSQAGYKGLNFECAPLSTHRSLTELRRRPSSRCFRMTSDQIPLSYAETGTQSESEVSHFSSVQFSSVAQSCLTLCDPMNHSTPGLPVHHQLPELTQTHVHRVSDAIQPSHPLSSPSPPAPNPSQHQSLFQ